MSRATQQPLANSTTIDPAPRRLTLKSSDLERKADQSVYILNGAGEVVVSIPKDEWQIVGNFFIDISDPDALL